jgi:hypothetical protein
MSPQRLDDRFGRHHAATRDQEHGEHCARLGTAHIHRCAVDDHLEAAQQPEFHALLPSDARQSRNENYPLSDGVERAGVA